jgi:hypothetical protein
MLFFAFELILSGRTMFGGSFARGYFGAIVYVLIFLTLGLGLGRWLQSIEDVHAALRCIVIAGALVVGCTFVQYLINADGIVWQGRLHGTTGNANFMGTLLATTLIPTLYFASRGGARLWVRVGYIAVAALSIVMILWTGSRTGGAMALVGIILLFWRHMGRFLLVGGVCTVFALLAWQYFSPDQGATAGRMVSGADTRSMVWVGMLHTFISSPIIGVSGKEVVGSESSYLLVATTTGLVGLIPFGIALFALNITMLHLWRVRHQLGPYRHLADLIVATLGTMQVGGIFEGYFCSTFSIPLLAGYVYFSILAFLKDYVAAVAPVQNQWEGDPLAAELYADQSLQSSAAMDNYYQE